MLPSTSPRLALSVASYRTSWGIANAHPFKLFVACSLLIVSASTTYPVPSQPLLVDSLLISFILHAAVLEDSIRGIDSIAAEPWVDNLIWAILCAAAFPPCLRRLPLMPRPCTCSKWVTISVRRGFGRGMGIVQLVKGHTSLSHVSAGSLSLALLVCYVVFASCLSCSGCESMFAEAAVVACVTVPSLPS